MIPIDKTALENQNWQLAHEWHAGLGLVYKGVDLGDSLTYEVLRVLGAVWKNELDRIAAENVKTPNS